MKTKIPIKNKVARFTHRGVELTPLTEERARSLGKGDIIRFIGPSTITRRTHDGCWDVIHPVYYIYRRRNITLSKKPSVFTSKLGRLLMAPKYTAAGSVNYFALVHRGDPYAADMKRHKKFIPINLKAFRRNLQGLAESTRNNIDNKLAKLPLHLKLEIFKGFTLEERIIYDFLYKNVDVVLGLKEDTEDAD